MTTPTPEDWKKAEPWCICGTADQLASLGHFGDCPAPRIAQAMAERVAETTREPAKTNEAVEWPDDPSDRLGKIKARCASYWNEHNINDAEVHRVLECIYRDADDAKAEAARLREELEQAVAGWRLEKKMRAANKAAVVDTVGGTVEGQPTHSGNYLQRLRELVKAEAERDSLVVVREAAEVVTSRWWKGYEGVEQGLSDLRDALAQTQDGGKQTIIHHQPKGTPKCPNIRSS